MIVDLTGERKTYFDARGKIVLSACPGSGKTTCLVHKISILKNECLATYGRYSGIACLSFTNNAKDEILEKYNKSYNDHLEYPHLVSTLDSFINTFITLPFFHLFEGSSLRPKIIENEKQIDDACKTFYYDSKGKKQEAFIQQLREFKNYDGSQVARSYAPSTVWIDPLGRYSFKGTRPTKVKDVDFQAYGEAIMGIKKRKGLFSNLDSAYLALDLLKKFPHIGKLLIQRFPYIMIDEAQDNSDIQYEIFNELVSLGLTNIELVGDPYQSLYEWRNAKPSIFFDKQKEEGWLGLPLTENRRSVQRIIDCFSIMRNAKDSKIKSLGVKDHKLPITIYKYNDINSKEILEHFEQTCESNGFLNSHVVVRGNDLKNKMTGSKSEINPWKESIPLLVLAALFNYQSGFIKKAVLEIRKVVINLQNPNLSYNEIQELLVEKKSDNHLNSQLLHFFHSLPEISMSIEEWTKSCVKVFDNEFQLDVSEDFLFKQKMKGFKMKDLKKEAISVYFNKPVSVSSNIPITTIHQVKGSTLDAILCFFDKDSGKETITFKDFKQATKFLSEKQRLIYVACSRPKQLLTMAFPDTVSNDDLRKTFGGDIVIHEIG